MAWGCRSLQLSAYFHNFHWAQDLQNALLLTQSLAELMHLWHLMTMCLLSLHLLDIGRYFHVTEDGEHEMKKRANLDSGILQAVYL